MNHLLASLYAGFVLICSFSCKPHDMVIVDIDTPYIHFSLDDVRECTARLSSYNGGSVFSDPLLSILKDWHERYGLVATLYVQGDFLIDKHYSLELIDNGDWLKFGYHGVGPKRIKYDGVRFYKQVHDIVGTDTVVDDFLRLDYFHADQLTCSLLKRCGCRGFLSCDDWSFNAIQRVSNYYLSEDQSEMLDRKNRMLDTNNGLYFVKTDFRLEHIKQRWGSVNNCLRYYSDNSQSKEWIIFSHEWCLADYLEQADSLFRWASENGMAFDFPMNR